jgi:hypothetical protein
VTVLVKENDGATVVDLPEAGIAPGVYTFTSEHGGISFRTRLVYIPRRQRKAEIVTA